MKRTSSLFKPHFVQNISTSEGAILHFLITRDIFDNCGKNIWISPLHNSSRRGKYCFSFSNTVASAGGLFNQRQKINVKYIYIYRIFFFLLYLPRIPFANCGHKLCKLYLLWNKLVVVVVVVVVVILRYGVQPKAVVFHRTFCWRWNASEVSAKRILSVPCLFHRKAKIFTSCAIQSMSALLGDLTFNQMKNKYDITSCNRICTEFEVGPTADFCFIHGQNHGLGYVHLQWQKFLAI